MEKVRYITNIQKITELSAIEHDLRQPVIDTFAFRTNTYYQSLIDWSDPKDPIRRLIIPSTAELQTWGRLDASNEEKYTKVPGLQHKYTHTALLLVNDVCGGYCRFCFRKRLFMDISDEVVRDISEGVEYIRKHREINNVLLTGGDPLVMSTNKLTNIIRQIREIPHVHIIRIGSKMPAFNPYRIINDPTFIDMLRTYSLNKKKIYLMAHFNHPRELTDVAIEALNMVIKAGVIVVNQTPLLRGINDAPEVMTELMNKLSYIGVPPYYFFQCRPTLGNKLFSVPVEESFDIFENARMHCSGLAKRARLVMSHSTGKIEIVGLTDEHIFFRYHRAAKPRDKARFMVFKRNPRAYWFDDYAEVSKKYSVVNPLRCYGPE
ncbi:KamA family radical SAM protein [candidate division KSB1 bacterium]|nr:KamA family radical SAM protein [candidate division KSB1 bacterium]